MTWLVALCLFGPPDSLRNRWVRWNERYSQCTPLVGDCVIVRTECVPAPPMRCVQRKEIHCVAGVSAIEEFRKVITP